MSTFEQNSKRALMNDPFLRFWFIFLAAAMGIGIASAAVLWVVQRRSARSITRTVFGSVAAAIVGAVLGLLITPYVFNW